MYQSGHVVGQDNAGQGMVHTKQGRAGQGRAGQGRAGQGRAGQGRAGQGRAGQGMLKEQTGQSRGRSKTHLTLSLYNSASQASLATSLPMRSIMPSTASSQTFTSSVRLRTYAHNALLETTFYKYQNQ